MKVEFYIHNIDDADITRVCDTLRQPFLSTGKVVELFEAKLAEYVGMKYAVGVSSCTAALHLSLLALGIGERSRVITTPMTFVATANAALYTGAELLFVDVQPTDGCIDTDKLWNYDCNIISCIIPVHLYGQRCNMSKIEEYAAQNRRPKPIAIVEDAAHALELNGFRGDAACFSFYPTKSITSSEGGAVVTNDKVVADAVKELRLHGMTKTAYQRYEKRYEHWDMERLGWKYNMINVQAAMLIGQLDRIEEFKERRTKICEYYEAEFRGVKEIQLLEATDSARLMFTILVDKGRRDEILVKLQERGIGVAVNYRPVHLLRYYREKFGYREGMFPVAEDIGARTITLPCYPKLRDEEAEYVVRCVKEIVSE